MTKPELKSLKPKKTIEEDATPDEKEQRPMAGFFEMFRFADASDYLYIVLAVCFSIITGMGSPAAAVLFGESLDTVIDAIIRDKFFDNIEGFLNLNNISRKDALNDPPIVRAKCPDLDALFGINNTCAIVNLDETYEDAMEPYVIAFVVSGLSVFLSGIGQVTFWTVAAERQITRIRRAFLTNMLHQDIGWFDMNDAGELNTKLSNEVALIQNGIGEKVGTVIQYLSTFVCGYIIGFWRGWQLTLTLMAFGPAMIGAGVFFSFVTGKMTAKETKAYSKAGSIAEEVISSVRTVFAFGGERKSVEKYDKNLGNAHKYGLLKGMANGGAIGFYTFVNYCTYAVGMYMSGKLIRNDDIGVNEAAMVFFSVSLGTFSLGIAAPGVQAIAEARGAAYSIFKIIDLKSSIDCSSDKGSKPRQVTGNIRFQDVHFCYPSRLDMKILRGLNMDVRPGQTVALVGSSGCGKSTIVQLLLRFYDPQRGNIIIDGANIKDLNVKWLRQNIGLVSQEPVLFATTIAENIRYGKEGVTMNEIVEATKMANAYDFIMQMPSQFNTLVGERGAQLSGGQKQRIAIARALVRDPKILLLDEATSALDMESEAIVQDALDKARQGRTTIVIAHRLSTIRTADIIIGMEHGEVKEKGTHDQLMARRGIYHTLVTNQSKEEEEKDIFSDSEDEGRKALGHSHDDRADKRKHIMGNIDDEDEMEMDEELPEVGFLKLLRSNSPEWLVLVLGSLMAIVHGGSQPAFAYLFAEVLKDFAKPNEEMKDDINERVLYMLCLAVITGICAFAQGWMLAIAGEALTRRLRSDTFKSMLRQEVSWYDKPYNSTGALTNRLAKDSSLVQGATGARMGMFVQCAVAVVGAVVLAFIYGWKLTFVALSCFPVLVFGGIMQMRVMSGNMSMAKEAIENASKVAVEAFENIRTVASLTKEDQFIEEYMFHFDTIAANPHKRYSVLGLFYGFLTSMNHFSCAAIFAYGTYLVDQDDMKPGEIMNVFVVIMFCGVYLGQSAAFGPDMGKAKAASKRIFYVLERKSEINADLPLGKKPDRNFFQSTVEFCRTKFSYPLRPNVKVLKSLSFRVEPGQTVALVGASGCGKSTCVSILERFYDTDGGGVIVGNNKIEDLNIRWLRSQIGLVSQEPVLFDCSIADNIAYGDNTRVVSMDEVIWAAKEANIHNFVSALPSGYDTNVGDKGTQLSGGQKQRIAIARALVRDPKILLLDEATSALDTESEKIVQEALDRAQEGRTCITIAHRLSTIRDANKIVVIRHGEAVEQGTHEELMARKGAYYRLQKAQNRGQ